MNTTYAIYRKSNGALVANGDLNDIFDGGLTGAGCNSGDPIVLWDEQAQRWFYSEFSLCNSNDMMLIAVSMTADPTGSWYSWSFDVDDTPDYMKYGIWQDGYYMATNTSGGNDVYVFDRTAMIAGDANPTMIGFDNPSRPSTFDGFHAIMPLDNDGAWAPSGTPGTFITIADDNQSNADDELRIYELDVDWATPGNSTFGMVQQLGVNSFTGRFDAADWDNIPQPGSGQQLDGVSTVLMYRAQYRNFSGTEKIVCTHAIAETGTEAAIRWYELERNGGNWSITQQGTYNPGGADDVSRWMPVIAMNGAGQTAIGFNISSPTNTTYPGIHAIGRSSCAPANTMDIAEFSIVEGGTSQAGANRWSDYANMAVDPNDDYTFWYTAEYMNTSTSTKYTKIVAFTLDESCTPPDIVSVNQADLYEDRGKQIEITGTDLLGCTFDIGGVVGTIISNTGTLATVNFPAGNYTDGVVTATKGSDTDDDVSITVKRRNTIPVVSGAGVTSDNHPTIQSAVDGLHAWYGTIAFNAGDLAGTKTINVEAGTYTDEVTLNSELNPVDNNFLIIQNNAGDIVTVDATGNSYGFNLSTVNYVTLTGFSVETANLDNIYAQGDNVIISYNKTSASVGGSGIKVETGTPFTITNNLSFSNYKYGIEILSTGNTIKNNTADNNGGTYSPQNGVLIFDYDVESGDYTGWSSTASTWFVYDDAGYANSPTHSFMLPEVDGSLQYTSIDVTGYDNLTISCYARSDENHTGSMNNSDELYGYYSFDNIDWTQQIFHIVNDHNTYAQYSVTGVNPTSNTLYIKFTGYCDADEWWHVDDVVVSGDETASASNTGAALYVAGISATVENNIFVAKTGSDDYFALISPGNSIASDFNTYYSTNAEIYNYNGGPTGPNGTDDIITDPLFVGGADYHLQSTADSYAGGEWPPSTATSGTWTTDGSDSPAIDAGNTADAFGNEPAGNGGVINQGAYGNTVQASKSAAVVAAHNWTGATDTDWQKTGNWDLGTIPTSTDNVVIPNGISNYPLIETTLAECNNITIENTSSVTIATNGEMTVSGTITNNASNAGLVINSDATGTGSLIQNSASGVSATVNQFFAASGRAWHMLGSPISNATSAIFPNTTYLFDYDESVIDYWTGSVYDSPVNGWTNYSGNLDVTKGYLYNEFQQTLTFTGLLNTSTSGAGITINYTNNGTNAPNGSSYGDFDGWNFISNPFTSAIDWTATDAGAAKLYDAIYVWDDVAGTYQSYVVGTNSWNGAATSGGSQYIAPMQGFFVKGDASETGGTLNIPANARIHNAATLVKTKENYETPENFLRLQVSANNYQDEIIVRFDEQATNNMDNRLDAFKMFSHYSYVPQIYTTGIDASTEYSINTLANLEEGETVTVPLRVYSSYDEFVISATEFNFKNMKIYLRDNNGLDSKDLIELNSTSVLTFTSLTNDELGRFELVFEKTGTTSILDINADYNVTIYPNPNDGNFYLRVDEYSGNYEVKVTSITGKLIYSNKFRGKDYQIIDLSNVNGGVYMVTTILNNAIVQHKRIVIK